MVLSTDMAMHFPQVNEIKATIENTPIEYWKQVLDDNADYPSSWVLFGNRTRSAKIIYNLLNYKSGKAKDNVFDDACGWHFKRVQTLASRLFQRILDPSGLFSRIRSINNISVAPIFILLK